MSKYLNIKLLRDMRRYWSQFVAVFLMAMLSTLIYTGLEGAWNGLNNQLDSYAAESNLADYWVTVTASTPELVADISDLSGVSHVEETTSIRLRVDDGRSPLLEAEVVGDEARTISVPKIIDGPMPAPDDSGIWVAEPYATEVGIKLGDSLPIRIGTATRNIKVAGIFYSPEKIYYTGTPAMVAPEPGLFSYAMLPLAEFKKFETPTLQASMLRVTGDASGSLNEQIVDASGDQLIRLTDRSSEDAVSTAFDRVDQIRNLSVLFSFIFVLLAILAMYTSTRRLVDMQSREIATLKSLGHSTSSIGTHFALYGLLAGGGGALLGLLIAPAMSLYVLSTQEVMLSMPTWSIAYTPMPLAVFTLVILICVGGAYTAARPALRAIPAEQLRPGIARGRSIFLERAARIWERTSYGSRWALRDSGTNPTRFAMGIIAVAGSLMLLFAGFGMADSMNGQVRSAFEEEAHYTARLAINSTVSVTDLTSAVGESQTSQEFNARTVPSDDFDRVISILGPGSFVELRTVNGEPLGTGQVGVTAATAERLNLNVGDTITVTLPGGRGDVEVLVDQIIDSTAPQGIVMKSETWEKLGQKYTPTTMYVGPDANLDLLAEQPGVIGVLTLEDQRSNAYAFVADLGGIFMLIRVFAILLTVIVLYSLGALAFTERVRDYATLKVLGFDTRSLRMLAARENLISTVLGLIVGFFAGYWFLDLYVGTFSTPRLEYNAQITPTSIAIAMLIAVFFSTLTTVLLGRRVRRIDMVTALKGIE